MQRRLVTWLVAILLIAHGLLGCCWHHRHVLAHAGSDAHHAAEPPGTAPVAGKTASQPARRTCCHQGHHRPQPQSSAAPDAEQPAIALAPQSHAEQPADPAPAAPCTEDDCVFVSGSRGTVAVDQPDDDTPAYPAVESTPGLHPVALDGAWLGRDRDQWADLGGWRAHRVRTGVWLI
jgi:hypothetical protein